MRHAEALFFIDHQQAEVLELDILGQQAVRADDHVEPAGSQALEGFLDLELGAETADHVDLRGDRRESFLQRFQVLRREHRRRRQECDLLAVHYRLEGGPHGHFGLAVPHVATEQAVHGRGRFHVALDVGHGRRLVDREVKLKGAFELFLPVSVGAERMTRHRLARGVELQQLFGHVAHGFLDLALGLLPGLAPEPIKRLARRSGVFLDQIQAFNRDK